MQITNSFIRPYAETDTIPLALTIGNFDGVHLGHQAILSTLVDTAVMYGYRPAAMTFSPHAKVFFAGAVDFLINDDAEKATLIADQGIHTLFQIPFNEAFSRTTAESFVHLLIDVLNVKFLLVGDDFRFGYQGKGDFPLLSRLCAEQGVTVQNTPTIRVGEQRVSSSRVRQAVKAADFDEVARLLGRPLNYQGEVITGNQLGRQLNFPTANIRLPQTRLLPDGVFAVRVKADGQHYGGMCNIGTKPTVDATNLRQIETHLFDFSGNLYGKTICIEPLAKIRDEQKFDGIEELITQLEKDKTTTQSVLTRQSSC